MFIRHMIVASSYTFVVMNIKRNVGGQAIIQAVAGAQSTLTGVHANTLKASKTSSTPAVSVECIHVCNLEASLERLVVEWETIAYSLATR